MAEVENAEKYPTAEVVETDHMLMPNVPIGDQTIDEEKLFQDNDEIQFFIEPQLSNHYEETPNTEKPSVNKTVAGTKNQPLEFVPMLSLTMEAEKNGNSTQWVTETDHLQPQSITVKSFVEATLGNYQIVVTKDYLPEESTNSQLMQTELQPLELALTLGKSRKTMEAEASVISSGIMIDTEQLTGTLLTDDYDHLCNVERLMSNEMAEREGEPYSVEFALMLGEDELTVEAESLAILSQLITDVENSIDGHKQPLITTNSIADCHLTVTETDYQPLEAETLENTSQSASPIAVVRFAVDNADTSMSNVYLVIAEEEMQVLDSTMQQGGEKESMIISSHPQQLINDHEKLQMAENLMADCRQAVGETDMQPLESEAVHNEHQEILEDNPPKNSQLTTGTEHAVVKTISVPEHQGSNSLPLFMRQRKRLQPRLPDFVEYPKLAKLDFWRGYRQERTPSVRPRKWRQPGLSVFVEELPMLAKTDFLNGHRQERQPGHECRKKRGKTGEQQQMVICESCGKMKTKKKEKNISDVFRGLRLWRKNGEKKRQEKKKEEKDGQ